MLLSSTVILQVHTLTITTHHPSKLVPEICEPGEERGAYRREPGYEVGSLNPHSQVANNKNQIKGFGQRGTINRMHAFPM